MRPDRLLEDVIGSFKAAEAEANVMTGTPTIWNVRKPRSCRRNHFLLSVALVVACAGGSFALPDVRPRDGSLVGGPVQQGGVGMSEPEIALAPTVTPVSMAPGHSADLRDPSTAQPLTEVVRITGGILEISFRNTPFAEAVEALRLATKSRVHGTTSVNWLINLHWRGTSRLEAWSSLLSDTSNGAVACSRSTCDVWIVQTTNQTSRVQLPSEISPSSQHAPDSAAAEPTTAFPPAAGQEDLAAIL